MNRYIQQLIEIFAKAETNPVAEPEIGQSFGEFIEHMRAIERGGKLSAQQLFGVSYEELPPVELLDKIQIQDLLIAILNAMAAKGTRVHIPGNGVPGKIVYEEILGIFKEGFYAVPGWHIDLCTGNCDDCKYEEYCDSERKKRRVLGLINKSNI
ncbi:MAG: hypothetical protein PHW92_09645 [Lutibacter sp.]|nr:hypothetical protein [Lutibacter sp.]